ncbi:MAG: chromate transporter [Sphaerochaetaceae bacterium]|jgi:chromate transporter
MPTKKPDMSKKRLLWTLFKTTLTISAFTFGGGYVIVPLIRKTFVEKLQWIDEHEMIDLIAVAQSSPGPIAVNSSIIVGYKVGGVIGAFATLLGTVTPPLITLTLLSYIYEIVKNNAYVQMTFYGMSIGVAIVIVDAVLTMAKTVLSDKKWFPLVVMILAFVATYILHINIVLIILSCAAIGALSILFVAKEEAK